MTNGEELREIQIELLIESLKSPPGDREILLEDLQIGAERSRDLGWVTDGADIIGVMDHFRENGLVEVSIIDLLEKMGIYSLRKIIVKKIPIDLIEFMRDKGLIIIRRNGNVVTGEIDYSQDTISFSPIWDWIYDPAQLPPDEKERIFRPDRIGRLIAVAARRGYGPIELNLALAEAAENIPCKNDKFGVKLDEWYDIHRRHERGHMGDWFVAGSGIYYRTTTGRFVIVECCNECGGEIDRDEHVCTNCERKVNEIERGCKETTLWVEIPDGFIRWAERVRERMLIREAKRTS